MIVRISLLLVTFALVAFIASDVLLRWAFPVLPELITQLGLVFLLTAFGLLAFSGLMFVGNCTIQGFCVYFSSSQAQLRKLLFTQNQQVDSAIRFQLKKLKLHFNHEHQRHRLLKEDNRKQFNLLSKAVRNDLRLKKSQLPKAIYRQWQKEFILYKKQQDAGSLIRLQQKIVTWVST